MCNNNINNCIPVGMYMYFIIQGKVKSFSLAYKWCETWDKRPLGRDPDRSYCFLHTSVKLIWSQPMALWELVAAYECAVIKKALH